MTAPEAPALWRFVRFGLLVTGKGEASLLPGLFRSLTEAGTCTFDVIRRIPQLRPIRSEQRKQTIRLKGIPSKDEEIALAARGYLQRYPDSAVLLIDDLEADWVPQVNEVYGRYRALLDAVLPALLRSRAGVHFLVNMLEAYYFADAAAVNQVTGSDLQDHVGDVETIRHPKNSLKQLIEGFDEIAHGKSIVPLLNLRKILSAANTCAALRTIVGWCVRALKQPFTDEYQLQIGLFHPTTRPQIDTLP